VSPARSASALSQPVTPSPELAAVIGPDPRPRSEITKDVWAYIKSHNLQDSTNRRMIVADALLTPVFGGKPSVSMFEMTALVNKHLTKSTNSA
jgi:chromatin remodeling complex protein RSC6